MQPLFKNTLLTSILTFTLFSTNVNALSLQPCPPEDYVECVKRQEKITQEWNEMNKRMNREHIDGTTSVSAPSAILALMVAYGLYMRRRKIKNDIKKRN